MKGIEPHQDRDRACREEVHMIGGRPSVAGSIVEGGTRWLKAPWVVRFDRKLGFVRYTIPPSKTNAGENLGVEGPAGPVVTLGGSGTDLLYRNT